MKLEREKSGRQDQVPGDADLKRKPELYSDGWRKSLLYEHDKDIERAEVIDTG